jgi:hypothetical protein
MTKVSSGKKKAGPPAHANSYAFHHNKSSKLTKHIGSLPIRFLCPPCVAVIEWRKKYRKYKPLTVVKKCTRCGQKKVKDAYHVICGDCVRETHKCGKCLLPSNEWLKEGEPIKIENEEIEGEGEELENNNDNTNDIDDEEEEETNDTNDIDEEDEEDEEDDIEESDDDNNELEYISDEEYITSSESE